MARIIEEWDNGLKERVLAEQQVLNARFRKSRDSFYAVPLPDRPDASFLMRERARPLVNIDDTPNRDIDAA